MRNKPTMDKHDDPQELHVELFAVVDNSANGKARTDEVRDLIAKIILLGRKKGRPSNSEREFQDAA